MGIRNAGIGDWKAIENLLKQLDYPEAGSFLPAKIKTLLKDPDERLLVYEQNDQVVALISY